ncbi:MAG: ATP-dependent DNA helicase RecG [Bacteroidales bacterium]|jgi:ATP-dependent DNA helicase RecG|nr:ATP-dependent DNA helicase RecG [Bacteroidales bacterium]
MSSTFLETPIEYLKGVGPARAEMLKKELQIFTFGELLTFFPFRYIDRSKFYKISEITDDNAFIQIKAKIVRIQTIGTHRNQRIIATVRDDSGEIDLVWFQGLKWIAEKLSPLQEYIIFGKPSIFNGRYNIPHPDLEIPPTQPLPLSETIRPVYSSTEKLKAKGLDFKGISRLMKNLLMNEKFFVPENLTPEILKQLHLVDRKDAFINIHFPQSSELLSKAQTRLKFEELFFIQLRLAKQRAGRLKKHAGQPFLKVGDYVNRFYNQHLTFELTKAQKRVIKEIRSDLGSGYQMNRLLQGDVGSGKTLVALMIILIALDNDCQCCLMAPTEILANQHYQTISGMLSGMNVNIQLLTGSTKTATRQLIGEGLLNGTIHLLIGTHALLEENVRFKRLGLVVIDEQHRFGVAQRAKLWEKNIVTPHVLVMTATPIPRTLAMTLYGDLDSSVIDEMPPGRKSIKTKHLYEPDRQKVIGFLRDKIREGRQIYIVYPLIQESETLDLKNLVDGFKTILTEFPPPEYAVGMVHGQMKQQEKDAEMKRFLERKIQILVATTVIEVGVDVPNASVMVIENAERFGLSQLHQLRGRVGRGSDQSYCILISGYELTTEARQRLSTMVRTTDGFEIAETDLRLRGPGDLLGTQQSGILNLRIADIVKDEKMLRYAHNLATDIIQDDPLLSKEKNDNLAHHLLQMDKHSQNWGLIS